MCSNREIPQVNAPLPEVNRSARDHAPPYWFPYLDRDLLIAYIPHIRLGIPYEMYGNDIRMK